MALYESIFVMRQDISAQEVHKLSEVLGKMVEEMGAKVLKKEYWGLRALPYIVKKNKRGHYMMLAVDASLHTIILELERNYKINEDIIRYMTVKVDKIDLGPSPIMQVPSGTDSVMQ